MTHSWCRTLFPAALSASLVAFTMTRGAAADAVPVGAPSPGASTAPAATTPDNTASLYVPTATTTPIAGFVEHLGSDAYPSSPLRGITDGSLWRTFHGLQWPYMPRTGVGVSGYVWIDTGYEYIRRGDPGDPSQSYQLQQGRFVLRATPTWSDSKWFVQGQVELVGNKDQTQTQPLQGDTDDVWVKFGKWKTFDVQLGRYEAWEIYHFGMGLDLYTLERQGAVDSHFNNIGQGPVPIYGVTNMFYRPGSIGAGALHIYATDWLRFELGTQFGDENGLNGIGARPVAVLDFGWLKLKGGAEWKEQTPINVGAKGKQYNYGVGGAIQVVLDPYVEAGINYAYGGQIQYDFSEGLRSPQGTFATYSVGGFANVRIVDGLLLGGGLNYTYEVNQSFDPTLHRYEDFDQWQGFAALQYHLFKQLYLKFVGGYALANFNPNTLDSQRSTTVHDNQMLSGRLRLEYLF